MANSKFDKKINRDSNWERRWDRDYIKKNFEIMNIDKVINSQIADLDFKSPDSVIDAIVKRVQKGTYSYTYKKDESSLAIIEWYKKLHNIEINMNWISLVHGTVNAMHMIVQAYTSAGDNVLIQTPIYDPFKRAILNNGRKIIENKLIFDGLTYKINFAKFEQQIIDNNVKLFLFCNPHNPGGIKWNIEDIKNIVQICNKYNVLIFSDEVHGDLVLNNMHNSLLNFEINNDNLIVGNSPNKLFNLGGIKGSYIISRNVKLLAKLNKQYEINSITSPNIFFQPALIAAYTNADAFAWVDELKTYVIKNYEIVLDKLKDLPNIKVVKLEASYLVWMEFDKSKISRELFISRLTENDLIVCTSDDFFGSEENWFRINIGCPQTEIEEIMNRLINIFK